MAIFLSGPAPISAHDRYRTGHLFLTKEVLYHLSYVGKSKPDLQTPKKPWSGRRGSNPRPSAWKADALPTELLPQKLLLSYGERRIRTSEGLRRQIYSLIPLASRASLQNLSSRSFKAGDGTRTRDLLITNQLLYQLSYASTCAINDISKNLKIQLSTDINLG